MHIIGSKQRANVGVWIAPAVELAESRGFTAKEIAKILKTVKENEIEFKAKYREHIR
jgi:hypothetical protein